MELQGINEDDLAAMQRENARAALSDLEDHLLDKIFKMSYFSEKATTEDLEEIKNRLAYVRRILT